MKMPPQIICRELPDFETADLDSVRAAFQKSKTCALRQTWLLKPENDFAPGIVRVGWYENALLIFAELTDADIFTNATAHNQKFWELGDTFEIFLRPNGQESYFEFHVAPNNLRLQLRFENRDAMKFTRQNNSLETVWIHEAIFESETWIQSGCWFVFAKIPADSICENSEPLPGSKWHFSFGRYDGTRGRKQPVISSTSLHARADFHRQEDWGILYFEPAPIIQLKKEEAIL